MHTSTTVLPAPAPAPSGLIRAAGPSYFPVALIARLPFAMVVVGLLTLVVAARDSLALGGAAAAATGLGTAVFGPALGACADRFGQRRVLLVAGLANSLLLMAMAWLAFAPVGDVVILVIALLIGASTPQVAPLSRSRLVGIIARAVDPARREHVVGTTMAYESAADEIVFVFGPVIVGVLAATLDPVAPVVGAALLALVFVTAFALHPSARLEDADTDAAAPAAPARELLHVAAPVLGALGMGLFFGSMLTSLTSFMADRGAAEEAGVVYGAMGLGSAALALAVAVFPASFTLRARWLVFAGILVGGTLLLPFVTDVLGMTLALLLIGVGIGPTLVTQYSLAAERSPRGRSATVMTMLGSGVVVGQSAASALTGLVAESSGTDPALLLPAAAAAVVLSAGILDAVTPAGRRVRFDN